jgi:hypothetical protein
MSILHFRMNPADRNLKEQEHDERFDRNFADDLHHGVDLIVEMKERLDKLHPIARETIIRLLSN